MAIMEGTIALLRAELDSLRDVVDRMQLEQGKQFLRETEGYSSS